MSRSLLNLIALRHKREPSLFKTIHLSSENEGGYGNAYDFSKLELGWIPKETKNFRFDLKNYGFDFIQACIDTLSDENWDLILAYGDFCHNATMPDVLCFSLNPSLRLLPVIAHDLALVEILITQERKHQYRVENMDDIHWKTFSQLRSSNFNISNQVIDYSLPSNFNSSFGDHANPRENGGTETNILPNQEIDTTPLPHPKINEVPQPWTRQAINQTPVSVWPGAELKSIPSKIVPQDSQVARQLMELGEQERMVGYLQTLGNSTELESESSFNPFLSDMLETLGSSSNGFSSNQELGEDLQPAKQNNLAEVDEYVSPILPHHPINDSANCGSDFEQALPINYSHIQEALLYNMAESSTLVTNCHRSSENDATDIPNWLRNISPLYRSDSEISFTQTISSQENIGNEEMYSCMESAIPNPTTNHASKQNPIPSEPFLMKSPTERLSDMTLDDLSKYFRLRIEDAAKMLGVGVTVLKKRCRAFGVKRWPQRKINSLSTLIHSLENWAKEPVGTEPPQKAYSSTIEELRKQKQLLEEKPQLCLSGKTLKLRQACFKAAYKQRRMARETTDSVQLSTEEGENVASNEAAANPDDT